MISPETTSAAVASEVVLDTSVPPQIDTTGSAPSAATRPVRRWLARRVLRAAMLAYPVALKAAGLIGRLWPRRHADGPCRILVTGKFYSDNWISAHLRPLAASEACQQVCVVSTYPIPPTPKVVAIRPSDWLTRLFGDVGGRILVFTWTAIRKRPDIVGGFHLLVNGLVAGLLARLVGARSLYFCVGGPMEVVDGGIWAENRVFGLLETPDPVVERRLIRAVGGLDLVITMGTRAVTFFRRHGIETRFHVISGGIDASRFAPDDAPRTTDLILVGRLAAIKRIDLLIRAVEVVVQQIPDVSATVVGDGPLRESLEALARDLGVEGRVSFVGQQSNVEDWLRRSKVFVLTSDSEGLALSVMEAMACGLPAVVSDVGDLGDLVEDGMNGHLVAERSPEAFAERITGLLSDESKWLAMSQAARQSARRYEIDTVVRQWDDALRADSPKGEAIS